MSAVFFLELSHLIGLTTHITIVLSMNCTCRLWLIFPKVSEGFFPILFSFSQMIFRCTFIRVIVCIVHMVFHVFLDVLFFFSRIFLYWTAKLFGSLVALWILYFMVFSTCYFSFPESSWTAQFYGRRLYFPHGFHEFFHMLFFFTKIFLSCAVLRGFGRIRWIFHMVFHGFFDGLFLFAEWSCGAQFLGLWEHFPKYLSWIFPYLILIFRIVLSFTVLRFFSFFVQIFLQ